MPTVNNFCIVIPTYNRLAYISEAIGSALKCEKPFGLKMQIVIIDDGSQDETTPEMISQFAMQERADGFYEGVSENNVDIYLRKIRNSERGFARNRGAEFAIHELKADWLLFLDADDVLASDALTTLFLHERPNVDMISAQYQLWDGAKLLGKPQPKPPPKARAKLDADAFWDANPMFIGATVMRARVFMRVGGFSENREISGSEDWLFLFKAVSRSQAVFVNHVTLWYRRHDTNTPPTRTETAIQEMHTELMEYLMVYYKENFVEAYQRIRFFHKLLIIGAYNSNREYRIAIKKSWALFLENPVRFFNWRALRTALSVLTRRFVS